MNGGKNNRKGMCEIRSYVIRESNSYKEHVDQLL